MTFTTDTQGLGSISPRPRASHESTHTLSPSLGGTMTIVDTIKAAHGNRSKLLSLANEFTLQLVSEHFDTTMQKAAPKVAQRLFDAQSITIKGRQVTYGHSFKRKYDLTDGNQACAALRTWGLFSHSLATFERLGGDYKAYGPYMEQCERHPSQLYSHIITSLKLVRHKNKSKN